ncbi:MAG: glycosyltransferase [Desulfovibrionaceae bacterium]|nr:glycosyltransferase [Desulfovibrionaceae bacterium]
MYHIINIIREVYPLSRVDDSVLFQEIISNKFARISWFLPRDSTNKADDFCEGNNDYYFVSSARDSIVSQFIIAPFVLFHKLFVLLFKVKADAIQAKDVYFRGVIALLVSKIFAIPFVYWLSFPFPEVDFERFRSNRSFKNFIVCLRGRVRSYIQYKILMPFADKIFVQSDKMKEDLAEKGVDSHKMIPVPMGVSCDYFDQFDPSPTIKKHVAYLGSLDKLRHLEVLIGAFKIVVDKFPDSKLYMIGSGYDDQDVKILQDQVDALGIYDNVVFTGQLERGNALDLINSFLVCVSPFYPSFVFNSTSPTKLVEYMAMGKACVANEHPDQKNVLENSRGGICVKWGEVEFAEGIISLLNDPEKAMRMGKNGKEWVKSNRDYDVIASVVMSEYSALFDRETYENIDCE